MSDAQTILVAEDDDIVRDVTVRMLRRAGYDVLPAADGEEAVRLVRERGQTVDLVLLDAMMPNMTGHEASLRIRKIEPSIPIIFCTGYDPLLPHSHSTPSEHNPVLRKPVDKQVLLDTVRETLAGNLATTPEPVG